MPLYLDTMFCDDVRKEVGRKLSFIGVYGKKIGVEFPFTFPKLYIVQKWDDVKKEDRIRVEVLLPGASQPNKFKINFPLPSSPFASFHIIIALVNLEVREASEIIIETFLEDSTTPSHRHSFGIIPREEIPAQPEFA